VKSFGNPHGCSVKQSTQNLYDVDYHLWLVETLKQLEDNVLESLDVEHLKIDRPES
jgi:hypothetical protein